MSENENSSVDSYEDHLELFEKASELAGRPVTVDSTKDGQHIVLFMQFAQAPPPKAKTVREALELFIEFMLNKKSTEPNLETEDTKENTDVDRDRPIQPGG